jgi:hypothetical protein
MKTALQPILEQFGMLNASTIASVAADCLQESERKCEDWMQLSFVRDIQDPYQLMLFISSIIDNLKPARAKISDQFDQMTADIAIGIYIRNFIMTKPIIPRITGDCNGESLCQSGCCKLDFLTPEKLKANEYFTH